MNGRPLRSLRLFRLKRTLPGLALIALALSLSCPRVPPSSEIFNNGQWIIAPQNASIPEAPFEYRVDGNIRGTTKLLTFASRVAGSLQYPQVFVINSSGFLRIKAGADPAPPLPFGQSIVLGPAIFGTSASFPATTLFFNPQVQTVSVNTSQLNIDGTGTLLIQIIANDSNLPANSTKTNQIMNLTWNITLHEPTNTETQVDVAGDFTFTEAFTPDPVRTAEFQSFRLYQISSMYIDDARHDVDALRYRDAGGIAQLSYAPNLAEMLLPQPPTALDSANPIFESLHTDDNGAPNGNTPSYRITVMQTTGPLTGAITPRAFFAASNNVNDDNLGAWLHQDPSLAIIPAGTMGTIDYSIVATTDPLPVP